MIEKVERDVLEAWRAHPVTQVFTRDLNGIRRRLIHDLAKAAEDAPLDRIRHLAGQLGLLDRVEMLLRTEGDET